MPSLLDLRRRIRAVKSKAELEYVRKAGELGDDALKAALKKVAPGANEGDILAAQQKAIFAEISAKLGDMNLFEHALAA